MARLINDFISGSFFRFAKKQKENIPFNFSIHTSQEIKPSETFENKLFNLDFAAQKINEYTLFPNEIFSFWQIIGNPNVGFKAGRSIKNGKIIAEMGGGLCQVSGIIYLISLQAGLSIIERFNHSIDIYTEETRFTPLGTDATVVYGYKDLRIKNNYPFPVKFQIEIINNTIHIQLLSTQKIAEKELFFEIKEQNKAIFVKVLSKENTILNESKYLKL